MGRVTGGAQTLGGQSYAVIYGYDLAGHVKSMTYPSGHVVKHSYDAAGRLNDDSGQLAFTGNLGDGVLRTYAQSIVYDANQIDFARGSILVPKD